ncbi:MAG: DUF1698 domain-containing protein [Sphingobacteriia bacterium]|nr:DUF1698 domain-containing protein [Sphingobacteriia bacterium]NCC39440.1 DUF1698 domain-containing protein [Gammaproteobacteria bacterium]
MNRSPTPQIIADGINELEPWFHRIELPHGLVTKKISHFGEPADHPRSTWKRLQHIIPEDLSGQSVLDVGCNGGFYAFRCHERKAQRILGVDARYHHVRQARFCAAVLEARNCSFERLGLYELDPRTHGTFDLVLALGLVYHLKHFYLGLEKLFWITGRQIILETAVAPADFDLPETPFVYGADQRHAYPLLCIENPASALEAPSNFFIPTPSAMAACMRSVGFEQVRIANVEDGRAILTGMKPSSRFDSTSVLGLAARIDIPHEGPIELSTSTEQRLRVILCNHGHATWLCGQHGIDTGAVHIAAELFKVDDPLYHRIIPWVRIPHDVAPDEQIQLEVPLPDDLEPGRYRMDLDLVSNHVARFQDLGCRVESVELIKR